MRARDIPQIAGLSTPEKILLVEDLWDNVASNQSSVPVPQSHKDELDRRIKSYESNPGALLSLAELEAMIAKRGTERWENGNQAQNQN